VQAFHQFCEGSNTTSSTLLRWHRGPQCTRRTCCLQGEPEGYSKPDGSTSIAETLEKSLRLKQPPAGFPSYDEVAQNARAMNIIPAVVPEVALSLPIVIWYHQRSAPLRSECLADTQYVMPGAGIAMLPVLSLSPYQPGGAVWDTQNMPQIEFPGISYSKLYTLILVDPDTGEQGGPFLQMMVNNMMGGAVNTGFQSFPYLSPAPYQTWVHRYTWLLYDQEEYINGVYDFSPQTALFSSDPIASRSKFDITRFAAQNKLGLAVGMNWMLLGPDELVPRIWAHLGIPDLVPAACQSAAQFRAACSAKVWKDQNEVLSNSSLTQWYKGPVCTANTCCENITKHSVAENYQQIYSWLEGMSNDFGTK